PAIVPTPNSYSRRISSNSSTLALHSNGLPLPGNARIRVSVRCQGGPNQTAEMGQFRLPKSRSFKRQFVPATDLLNAPHSLQDFQRRGLVTELGARLRTGGQNAAVIRAATDEPDAFFCTKRQ